MAKDAAANVTTIDANIRILVGNESTLAVGDTTPALMLQYMLDNAVKSVSGNYTVLSTDPPILFWDVQSGTDVLTLLASPKKAQWVFNTSDTYQGTLSESMGVLPPLTNRLVGVESSAYVGSD